MYWKRLYGYLMVLAKGDESIAADLAQKTMVRVVRCIPRMESEAAIRAWLRGVGRNSFIDMYRARVRRPFLVEWTEEVVVVAEDPHSGEIRLLAALELGLQQLTVDERALVEEIYLEGRKQGEVAGALGLSLKAVESRLTRLRQKLRKFILADLRHE